MKKIDQAKRTQLINEAHRLLDRIEANMKFLVEESQAHAVTKRAA